MASGYGSALALAYFPPSSLLMVGFFTCAQYYPQKQRVCQGPPGISGVVDVNFH
jgi:hypothetical protein